MESLKSRFRAKFLQHIVKGNLFAPVVDAFIRNNGRYNLLESAILELFEFIKLEDIKTLCVYFVENFSKIFDEIEYVQTFKYLKTRYDQYQERLKERDKILDTIPMIRNNRYRRDQRQLDEEEEIWFNEEEDFSEELDTYSVMKSKIIEKNGPSKNSNTSATSVMASNANTSPNQSTTSASPVSAQTSTSPPQSALSSTLQTSPEPDTILPSQESLQSNIQQVEISAESSTALTSTAGCKSSSDLEENPVTVNNHTIDASDSEEVELTGSSATVDDKDFDVKSDPAPSNAASAETLAETTTSENIAESTIKKGLVDYEGDSDEEDDDDSAASPTQKKPRLA